MEVRLSVVLLGNSLEEGYFVNRFIYFILCLLIREEKDIYCVRGIVNVGISFYRN